MIRPEDQSSDKNHRWDKFPHILISLDFAMPEISKSRLRRTAAWLLAFRFLQAGLAALISLWLARTLGAEEYGLLSYGLIVGAFVLIFVNFGTDVTLVRDLVQSDDTAATFTASTVQRLLLATCVGVGISAWACFFGIGQGNAWAIVICTVWGVMGGLLPTAWYDYRYRMHFHAAIGLAEKVLFAIAVVGLIGLFGKSNGAIIAALCLLASRIVSFVVQWGQTCVTFRPSTTKLCAMLRSMSGANAWIFGAALTTLLITHANQIALRHEHGAAELAHFFLAFQVIALLQLAQGQIVRLLHPYVAELTTSRQSMRSVRARLMRYCAWSVLLTMPVAVLLAVFTPSLIRACLTAEFEASVLPLRILCLWSVVYAPTWVINAFLIGFRLNSQFLAVTVAVGLVSVVLGQLLIPQYGAAGVAVVLVISQSLSVGMQWVLTSRKIESLETRPVRGDVVAVRGLAATAQYE